MKQINVENDRILVIAPHPDDESIGTGGLLLMYPQNCMIIVATNGARAGNQTDRTGMALEREREFCRAMNISGIKNYVFLRNQDGELCNNPKFLSEVNLTKYTKIFLPYKREDHPDHRSVFSYAIQEIGRQKAYDIEVFEYETRGSMDNADCYLDISDVIDRKKEMIYCYQSQIEIFDHAAFAAALNRFRAAAVGAGSKYYEVYKQYEMRNEDLAQYDSDIKEMARYRIENNIIRKWLQLKIYDNQFINSVLNDYQTIGIYGYGYLGRLLVHEITGIGKDVTLIIDKNKKFIDDVVILEPGKKYQDVDLMIVTCIYDSDNIVKSLAEQGYNNVISINDLLSHIRT